MNPKVQTLVARANAALKGQAPIGGTILVNFGTDGEVFVAGDGHANQVVGSSGSAHGGVQPANCTIALSLAALDKLEHASRWTQAMMLLDGEVVVSGDRDLAKKFATILTDANV
jgi:hypothetical protein